MTGLLYIDASGRADYLTLEELQAVELSGRSTWQEYASTPGEWPERTYVNLDALMELRPGSVPEGDRPTEDVAMNKYQLPHLGATSYKYHLNGSWTCYVSLRPGMNPNALLNDRQFERAMDIGLACEYCMRGAKPNPKAP